MNCVTELMPHQIAPVDKLEPVRVGALFMEMGTGKTRTAIELVCRRRASGKVFRCVWFCPVSIKETVRHEILKHTDCTDADIIMPDSTTSPSSLSDVFWIIVGIETMSASTATVLTLNETITEKTMVIVDESSYIKGHHARRTLRITSMSAKARYRLILSGTPVSQGIVDLYSQMYFLSPQILGYSSFHSFARNHLEYSEKYPGMIVRSHNVEFIAAKIQPYVYQVTKAACLTLPVKLHESHWLPMSAPQEDAYRQAKEEILTSIDADRFECYTLFRLFGALQQIASGYWHRWNEDEKSWEWHEYPHYRSERLVSLVESMPASTKVIIWTKFEHDIKQASAALRDRYGTESVSLFYGKVNESDRAAALVRFRTGPERFLIATQGCGGHGLTLNEASQVIFYTNGFKYSERLQAEDRCHRIGQAMPVTYHELWCSCGIERRIDRALSRKGNLVSEFRAEIEKIKNDKAKLKKLVKSL